MTGSALVRADGPSAAARSRRGRRFATPRRPAMTGTSGVNAWLSSWAHRSAVLPTAAAVLTFVALLPVLLTTFGFLDDYGVLYTKQTDPQPAIDAALVQGRPVAGLLQGAAFAVVDSIDGLVLLRAFSVLCFAAFAAVSVRALRRSGYSGAVALVFVAALLVLPSTHVMSAWAILLMGPAALLLGLLAAVGLASRLDEVLAVRTQPWLALRAAMPAFGLLLAALLAYQPSAMVFWPVFLLLLLAPVRQDWSASKTFIAAITALVIGGAASVGGYAAVKLGVAFVGGDAPRTALTVDLPAKLDYVLRSAAPRVFDPLSLTPRPLVAAGTAFALGLLLLLAPVGPWRRRLLGLGLWVAAGVLSYLPSLATVEDWASARSLSATFVVPVVACALVLQGLLQRIPTTALARGGAAAVLSLAAAAWSVDALQTYWTGPQAEELSRARAQVAPALDARPADVAVLRSDYTQTLAPGFSYDEAGIPSTYASWVPVPLTQLLAREQTGSFLPRVRLVDRADVPDLPARTVVVDYGAVLQPWSGAVVSGGGA